ncbi:BIG1-domain-containing protein [Cryphonectria parasitica EP155]|uniref:Protein BIG1 n=1 Tax=Cryphonectria parasitica (strain ATCC 38755 / EP155) TaxID=660469 RepID=A0A9P4XSY3_CRYP1|nr:BIG1-domain-containing protein [Cryphonectria parasitica EP155]KAF3760271.1 BIG1-domain-containing protein [Cryphonectria parasitica EP155]
MRYSIAAGLLASGAAAFSDSSPFLMYSTSKLSVPSEPSQLQSTASVLSTAHALLSTCPTSLYLLLTHPNAHASDLRDPATGACLALNLCGRTSAVVNSSKVATSHYGVAEVVGPEISATDLQAYIEGACSEQGKGDLAAVVVKQLDGLPLHDELLDNQEQIRRGVPGDDYTVIYFASPHEPPRRYEAEFGEAGGAEMPLELRKREWEVRAADGGNTVGSAPLFVKYQFFTPGIFMGFVAVFLMLAMLYVGLNAVASLQVSYGAFDKEMGPAAQKKTQ